MHLKLSAGEFFYILAKSDENFMAEFLEFSKAAVNGQDLRTNQPINFHELEGILFGLEKCIEVIISDLDSKMDQFLREILMKPLLSDNIFL